MNSVPGLPTFLLQSFHRWLTSCVVMLFTVSLVTVTIIGCQDRSTSPSATRWDWIVEGPNNDLYFVDRNGTERVSNDVVRVPVKYEPTKGHALIGLQDLSKAFGGEVQDAGQEYTVSIWEFNCAKPEGRCLSLTHYKKGSKMASYEYPHQSWSSLENAAGTKVLRDVVCDQVSGPKK